MSNLEKKMELAVLEQFYRSLVDFHTGDYRERAWDDVYLTNLTMECMRKPFIEKIIGRLVGSRPDIRGVMRMSIGTNMHNIPLWNNEYHEKSYQWEGIRTRIDDFKDGLLVDKKYTWSNLRYAPFSNHRRQVEYEANILEKNKVAVLKSFVVYYHIGDIPNQPKICPIRLRPLDIISQEMLGKKARLVGGFNRLAEVLAGTIKADPEAIPPPRAPGWNCGYCTAFIPCFKWEDFWKRVEPLLRFLEHGNTIYGIATESQLERDMLFNNPTAAQAALDSMGSDGYFKENSEVLVLDLKDGYVAEPTKFDDEEELDRKDDLRAQEQRDEEEEQ